VRITTERGRQLTVTADHELHVYEAGRIITKRASAVTAGDHAVAPHHLDVVGEHTGVPEIDRLEALPTRRPVGALAPSREMARDIVRTDGGAGGYLVDEIASVEVVASDTTFTYCLTVEGTHSLIANDLSVRQCDGDEDCVMLLMDGLLNFSEAYLPSSRGGRMDAPLVLSTRIDPAEIDDEAHNIETVDSYPLELYEVADRYGSPNSVELTFAEDFVEADRPVRFRHTDDPSDIAAGPRLSAYKTLESMDEKLNGQLELARKLRAVDEADVAERVIEGHYLPDLLGNLRAFTSQEVRCRDCETKFRRPPLTGGCPHCGGTVSLTVYEGMVVKYLESAQEIADRYEVRPYTRQRLEVLERTLSSLFEDDTNKQAGIADFM
ncbi:MAG: hypothetical protein ACOC42_02805, partial [Halobacteriota archaeon]